MLQSATFAAFLVFLSSAAHAKDCLHGADESTEQAARRKAALTATRTVNNIQANQPLARAGGYLRQLELAVSRFAIEMRQSKDPLLRSMNLEPSEDILPGWTLKLDVTEKGYWFMVKDKTDPCGFAFISNQDGIIYPASYLQ